jgi:DNA-binding NarL/FixJ family response regulator
MRSSRCWPKACPNSQIADQLIISDATVKTHVARVLMKLNLADRVHAVIFAYETGLVQPGETAP